MESNVTEVPFFSSKVKLGPDGISEIYGLGDLTDYEEQALKAMMPELTASIEKGVEFVKNM